MDAVVENRLKNADVSVAVHLCCLMHQRCVLGCMCSCVYAYVGARVLGCVSAHVFVCACFLHFACFRLCGDNASASWGMCRRVVRARVREGVCLEGEEFCAERWSLRVCIGR